MNSIMRKLQPTGPPIFRRPRKGEATVAAVYLAEHYRAREQDQREAEIGASAAERDPIPRRQGNRGSSGRQALALPDSAM